MYPDPQHPVVLEVVEEHHRASNVNVGELEECLPDVRHLGSSWEDERLDRSDPASRATGHSRDMGPTS